jgi:hypothetical protein
MSNLDLMFRVAQANKDPRIMQAYVVCVLAFTSAMRSGSYTKSTKAKKNVALDICKRWE